MRQSSPTRGVSGSNQSVTAPDSSELSSVSTSTGRKWPERDFGLWGSIALAGLLICSVFLCYSSLLGAYFVADDVWHLPVLCQAFAGDWNALFGQFLAPWTYHTSIYLFYRPVTELFLALDYLLWGGNPFGFHLSNILMHVLVAVCVYFSSREMIRILVLDKAASPSRFELQSWAPFTISAATALTFAVYPAHAEVVSWIATRCDTVGALFYLGSIIFYCRFLRTAKPMEYSIALVSAALGFFSKEGCATLPLVIALLDLAYGPKHVYGSREKTGFFETFLSMVKRTWPFFAIFIAYFALRWLAIGEPVGGYIGSVARCARETFFSRLFSAEPYWRLLHPLNLRVFGELSLPEILVRGSYLALAGLIMVGTFVTPCIGERRRAAVLLFGISALMLAPSLSIWQVTDGMFGSRLAYLACFPAILAIIIIAHPLSRRGEASPASGRLTRYGAGVLLSTSTLFTLACLGALFIFITRGNTSAWIASMEEVRQLRQEIERKVSALPPDKRLVVLNLSADRRGAVEFFSTDFIEGLLKPPFSRIDISDRVISLDGATLNSPYVNYSQYRYYLSRPDSFSLVSWDEEQRKLEPLEARVVPPQIDLAGVSLPVVPLGRFKALKPRGEQKISVFANRTRGNELASFLVTLPRAMSPEELAMMEVSIVCRRSVEDSSNSASRKEGENRSKSIEDDAELPVASLSWSRQSYDERDADLPVTFRLVDDGKPHRYPIVLSQYKRWLLNSGVKAIRIDLPVTCESKSSNKKDSTYSYEFKGANIARLSSFVPDLSLSSSGAIDTNGLIRPRAYPLSFDYDFASIPGASSAVIEISKPFEEFHMQNGYYRDQRLSERTSATFRVDSVDQHAGRFELPSTLFPTPGYYQVRLIAVDGLGRSCGAFSDPVTVDTRQ